MACHKAIYGPGFFCHATQYNGNIGQQQWVNSRDASQVRGYLYYYDKANRLTMATYLGPTGEDVGLNTLTYDPNGNLLSLNRTNVDQLHYSYGPGNSLTAVSDDITYNQDTGDFRDGNTVGVDYTSRCCSFVTSNLYSEGPGTAHRSGP